MSPLHSSSSTSFAHGPLPLLPVIGVGHSIGEKTASDRFPIRVVDAAVAMAILALLVALLVPTLSNRDLQLPSVTRSLVDHLRLTRAGAASRSVHFRVTFQPHTYVIEQLQDVDGDGTWEPDAKLPAWRVTLPPTVAIEHGANTVLEFDGRGSITPTSRADTVTPIKVEIKDSESEKSEVIEILPSGKVQRS